MVTPDVIGMRVNQSLAEPRFLMHYLNSDVARRLAFGMAFGTTRLRLTLPLFRQIRVPLPPLQEQQRVVSEIERRLPVTDAMERTLIVVEERSAGLRNRILSAGFAGDLIAHGTFVPGVSKVAV